MKSPAFQFYPKDYESDESVKMMSLEQEGAFLRLLCHAWLNGSVPADVVSLAKICRVPTSKMARLWPGVAPCFVELEGARLVNPKQERGRVEQDQFRKERSESGKRGAASKWMAEPRKGNGSAIAQPRQTDGLRTAVSVLPSAVVTTIPIPTGEDTPLNRSILAACAEIAGLTGKEPTEILKAHSMVPPRRPGERAVWIVNLATASEGWRIRTGQDLNAELSRLKAPPPPGDEHEGLPTRGPWEAQ